jgi:Zn-dependent M28 family amino/carboxypeptidase
VRTASAAITPELMHRHIAFLSSDDLRGRMTPSAGLTKAAEYIAAEFRTLGLEAVGDSGGYVQNYDVRVPRPGRPPATMKAPNVVALLRGSDPTLRDTYVVFSAHIDHVGVGIPDASGDSIYNGADDDASGTAAVLAVARAFAALPERPARSIVFLGVSGEEGGLFGSQYFVERPIVPVQGMVADMNLDMIGRNAADFVAAVGYEYTTLGPLARDIARANPELGLRVVPDPWPNEQLFFRSDHFNFARKGVPAIFFTSGLHEDYHQPSDEVDKIDTSKAARIAQLAFQLAHRIATTNEKPAWTESGRREVLGRN